VQRFDFWYRRRRRERRVLSTKHRIRTKKLRDTLSDDLSPSLAAATLGPLDVLIDGPHQEAGHTPTKLFLCLARRRFRRSLFFGYLLRNGRR